MYIKELKVQNFKSFNGDISTMVFNMPNGECGSGLNIFVGENNTGKSTIFEAIDFLKNGIKKLPEEIKNKNNPTEDVVVEITFEGNITGTIDSFSKKNKVAVFKKNIYDDGTATESIRFSRKTSSMQTIQLWSNGNDEYKDEPGIKMFVRKLFETNFVWADTNPNDQASFGSTTICGNLLKDIMSGFTDTDDYGSFSKQFDKTFNDEDSKLRKKLKIIEEKTQAIFKEQFGHASIRFRFNELKIDSFFKNTTIDIDDGVRTSMEEKGSGMQRSVALALLQVYADELTKHPEEGGLKKPFFLFIDEPEICLHPKAQSKLFKSLLELSKTKQVFLATHSPYFLVSEYLNTIGLFIFCLESGVPKIDRINGAKSNLLPWSPTWGEINYEGYKLPTIEFHNDLYGRLQELSEKRNINKFEGWLVDQGVKKTKQ
ncbi:hypothetical protein [uncultured Gammaproteobacteria bacterium]|nr:hypothetical protein [uncultured Gammaproteobacteria bacterium]